MTPEDKEKAVKDACVLLTRRHISSWSEHGPDASDPKRELEHAIALVECALSDKVTNDIFAFCDLGPPPLTDIALRTAIPILKRARPPKREKRGSYSLTQRDQVIVETIVFICQKYPLKPTRNPASRDNNHDPCGCSIVAEALGLSEKTVTDIWCAAYPN